MLRRLLSVIYSSIAAWAFSLKQTEWSCEAATDARQRRRFTVCGGGTVNSNTTRVYVREISR